MSCLVAIVLYVVLVPVFFALALWYRDTSPLARPFMFLVREVRPEVWWFEVLALVWRFVITGVLLLISDDSLRLIIIQIFTIMMITVCGAKRPYLSDRNNYLALVIYTAISFIVLFTSVLYEETLRDAVETQMVSLVMQARFL